MSKFGKERPEWERHSTTVRSQKVANLGVNDRISLENDQVSLSAFFASLAVRYFISGRAIASKGVVRHFVPPHAARFFGASLEKEKAYLIRQ